MLSLGKRMALHAVFADMGLVDCAQDAFGAPRSISRELLETMVDEVMGYMPLTIALIGSTYFLDCKMRQSALVWILQELVMAYIMKCPRDNTLRDRVLDLWYWTKDEPIDAGLPF